MTKMAAIIGGGVIGGGWAARFLLNGWDVQIFDPDPEAERKILEVLENARRSLPGLSGVALPAEGDLRFCDTIGQAVEGATWVQESVPERLDIKHKTFAEVQAACSAQAVIGSSTSGFKPSQLQEGAARPEQIMVCHPFNPVYLLPLIEVVTTPVTDADILARAKSTLVVLGMYPLHLKKEIDAHVADRFLEAVWREALWLIKDGIATTEEIDNAIRYGFGIRWAQMGLFETYRVAGGEAGMKHFMAQFGPALKWPWTKLMDVPNLDDALIDMIARQSDEQSDAYSIRELERIRDNNLVAMMRALKGQDWGAGALLKSHDTRLMVGTPLAARAVDIEDPSKPVLTVDRSVPLDWTDYNGHMNEAKYLQAFADATDRFMEVIGCDAAYIATGGSYFTAETHIRHIDEVHAGMRITIQTSVLGGGGKKMHLWHAMYAGEVLIATGEHFLLHVSLTTRKPIDASPAIDAALQRFVTAQAGLPRPDGAGRGVA
ncbi:MAG: carnitine 3-dehydrogenase [Roseobacter sp.]